MSQLTLRIPAFAENDWIPIENTARGIDISPEIHIDNIIENAISMVITLDDSQHPFIKNYNHWVIWNLPIMSVVPAAIAKGQHVKQLGNAVQGLAFGKHCYRGPRPPLRVTHTYTFTVYILDQKLELVPQSKRKDVYRLMEGHVLQTATYSGKFQSGFKHTFVLIIVLFLVVAAAIQYFTHLI